MTLIKKTTIALFAVVFIVSVSGLLIGLDAQIQKASAQMNTIINQLQIIIDNQKKSPKTKAEETYEDGSYIIPNPIKGSYDSVDCVPLSTIPIDERVLNIAY